MRQDAAPLSVWDLARRLARQDDATTTRTHNNPKPSPPEAAAAARAEVGCRRARGAAARRASACRDADAHVLCAGVARKRPTSTTTRAEARAHSRGCAHTACAPRATRPPREAVPLARAERAHRRRGASARALRRRCAAAQALARVRAAARPSGAALAAPCRLLTHARRTRRRCLPHQARSACCATKAHDATHAATPFVRRCSQPR
jgi:hypothetical protein